MPMDERSPLLQFPGTNGPSSITEQTYHDQFCQLVGVRPINHPHDEPHRPHPDSLYIRAIKHRRAQSCTYMFTATLVNTLLLTQVVLGAALTGLGASNSSRILITVFGALNTVIAGVVAFLKSRGQPMRARMFRDDLERVVDEIENSSVMWFGISNGAHGYDAIDTDDQVTVRGEVARLTRLYDRAVKTNTMNDPDMYSAGNPNDSHMAALRKGPGVLAPTGAPAIAAPVIPVDIAPAPVPAPVAAPAPAADPAPVAADPDDSPATKAPEPTKPKEDDKAKAASPAEPAAADAGKPAVEAAPADKPNDTAPPPPAEAAPAATPAKAEESKPVETPPAPAPAPAPAAAPAASATTPPAPAPAAPPAAERDEDESPASAAKPPMRREDSKKSESKRDGPNGSKD